MLSSDGRRPLALNVLGISICPGVDESLHQLQITSFGGAMKRRPVVVIGCIDVHFQIKEELDKLRNISANRTDEGWVTRLIRSFNTSTPLDQILDRLDIA